MSDQKDKRIKKLEEELRKSKDNYEKLRKEFEKYKAVHVLTVSNLRKALKIKVNSDKKHAPLGAPKGHRGYARKIPERIDYVKELRLRNCPRCNTLLGNVQEIRTRHVTDIQLISIPRTTKYKIPRKYCPNCKKIVEPEVPNALPHAQFGLNLMLLVMYLKLGLRLPCNKIRDYFITMYNLPISEGEVIKILRQLEVAFGGHYKSLENAVKIARVKHSDTTSWRINGKNYFAWVFIAYGVVLYKIHKRNNHKVALKFLGKQKGNVLCVDRFSAYRTLAEKAGFKLQLCWSHITENSKQLSENFGKEAKNVHTKLKQIYSLANGLNHKGNDEMVEQLKAEIFQLTKKHYTHSTIRKFVNNLYHRDADNLFRFVTDPEIDPTNNISERELRALVIIRKISNGSRSKKGAKTTATLLSIIQTLRLNNQNVLQGMHNILKPTSEQ